MRDIMTCVRPVWSPGLVDLHLGNRGPSGHTGNPEGGMGVLGPHSGRTTEEVSLVDKSRVPHRKKRPHLSSSGVVGLPVSYG